VAEHRLLIIDDDTRLAEMLVEYLAPEGIELTAVASGVQGLRSAQRENYDLIILDVMLPGLSGFDLLKQIRLHHATPIIFLTARNTEIDRVLGLEIGADDYVAKPFSPRELLARLKAVLRRSRPDVVAEQLTISNIAVDVPSRVVTVAGKPVELTGLEFDILVALLRRAGRVIPRDALLKEAGRSDVVVGERTVDVHISHLRQKLGDDPPKLIKTVRGVGYVLVRDV
jgi:DNA-binding response OmpR family regulator